MKKLVAISLVLLLCFGTFSVAAVEKTPDRARYIELGEVGGYTLLYDTETVLAGESYTRIIGDYYFTTYSEQLGLSISDGENTTPLESAYGSLIGDNSIKSVAKAINKSKENGIMPFDNWTVTKGEVEVITPATEPHEKLGTGSGKVYYLFGWIYGRNYACEENDYEMGEFRFENGQLTAFFTEDAYVGVKEENNAAWYMTNGWLGTNVTSVTLYNTSITGANSDKLYVPAGVEVHFTLVENMDGTLTLSYSRITMGDPGYTWEGGVPGGDVSPSNEPPQVQSTTAPTEPEETDPLKTEPQVSRPSTSQDVPKTDPTEPLTTEQKPGLTDPADTSSEKPTSPTTRPAPTSPSTSPKPSTDPTEKPTTPPTVVTTEDATIKLNIIAGTLQAGKVINLYATDKSGKKVSATFSSGNKKVAKVTKKGKLYALKRGVAMINVKYKKKKVATCLINVVTSPKLSKNKIKLKKGQTKTVKISGKVPDLKNTYKNTKIAKVKSSRKAKKLKIRGLKRGTTKLTIKVNGVKLRLKVTVS